MDWWDYVAPIYAAVIGGLVGWITSARKSRSKREEEMAAKQDAQCQLLKAIGKKTLLDAYTHYCVEGHHMSYERGSELYDTYAGYEALGGDGFVKQTIWPALSAKNPYIVGADVRGDGGGSGG